MSTRVRVLKWPLPIDDEPHEIGGGDVLLIDRADLGVGPKALEVWTRELVDDEELQPTLPTRTAQVYSTGQLVDGAQQHLGSFVDRVPFLGTPSYRSLVWHVFEVEQP